jgi:hypothetical protein
LEKQEDNNIYIEEVTGEIYEGENQPCERLIIDPDRAKVGDSSFLTAELLRAIRVKGFEGRCYNNAIKKADKWLIDNRHKLGTENINLLHTIGPGGRNYITITYLEREGIKSTLRVLRKE